MEKDFKIPFYFLLLAKFIPMPLSLPKYASTDAPILDRIPPTK